MEGGRGILTGTGDEKGLLQLVLHKPHQTYQSKWEQQTKKERVLSWNSTLETQSESKARHCLGNQGQCFSVHVLIFYGYNSSMGAAKKSLSYLLSFSVFFFPFFLNKYGSIKQSLVRFPNTSKLLQG